MGIVARQGIKGTIATYIGTFIGAINVLWLFPKFLTASEIGLTRVIIDAGLVMAALSQLGGPNITDKFFSFFKDDEKKHKGFFILTIVYPLVGFLVIGLITILLKPFWITVFAEHAPLLLDNFCAVIILSFFILYMNVLEAYARIHFRIVVPMLIREVFLRIFLAAIVVLYHFKVISLDHLILLIIVSYSCAVLLLLGYIKNLKKLFLSYKNIFYDKALYKEMMFFGLLIFLGGAWGLIAAKVDVFMLTSMKGTDYTGIYSIAFYIGTIIEIPRRALSQISTPLISQAMKNNDMLTIHKIYSKTSLNQLIVGLLLFLLVWCNVDFLLSVIPNSEVYKAGKYVILIIGLGRLTDMATGVNTEIILNSHYYKFNFLLVLMTAVLLFTSSYFLIPVYGINGAAVSTLISFIIFNAVKSIFIYIKFRMQPFTSQSFLILMFALIAFALAVFTPVVAEGGILAPFINIAIRSLIILLAFAGPVIYFKVSEDVDLLKDQLFKKMKG
jgi:O-antigen/teichoic acid export membrane protein